MNSLRAFLFLALIFSQGVASAELIRDLEYARPDGVSLKLDVNVPEGAGPFPIAILVHGGGFTNVNQRQFVTPLFAPLTEAKFTWFSINYRMAPQNFWPACFEDTQTAIRWVKAHCAEYKGDPNRIALLGYSAGGHLALLAALRSPRRLFRLRLSSFWQARASPLAFLPLYDA